MLMFKNVSLFISVLSPKMDVITLAKALANDVESHKMKVEEQEQLFQLHASRKEAKTVSS
jgi:hypothetical protein